MTRKKSLSRPSKVRCTKWPPKPACLDWLPLAPSKTKGVILLLREVGDLACRRVPLRDWPLVTLQVGVSTLRPLQNNPRSGGGGNETSPTIVPPPIGGSQATIYPKRSKKETFCRAKEETTICEVGDLSTLPHRNEECYLYGEGSPASVVARPSIGSTPTRVGARNSSL